MIRAVAIAIFVTLSGIGAAQVSPSEQKPHSPQMASAQSAAWKVLEDGVAEGNPDHRRQALIALGGLGADPAALKILHHALQDKDPVVRQTVCAVLGSIKAPESVPYLQQALKDRGEVAFAAAKALADMGNRSGDWLFQEVLTGECKNTPGMIQGAMRDARGKLRNPAGLALMGVKEASGALLGPASMGIIVAQDALKDTGAPGRSLAALYLAQDPNPYVLTLLEWALSDSNWMVRAEAARALGERGNAGTVPKLRFLLDDAHHAVRYMAAASIIRLTTRNPAPAPVLVSTSAPAIPVKKK